MPKAAGVKSNYWGRTLDAVSDGAFCPGAVLTPTLDRYAVQKGMTIEQVLAAWAPAHLLNRLAEPQEIANAILFLASEEASFITGASLMVDGGYTVR